MRIRGIARIESGPSCAELSVDPALEVGGISVGEVSLTAALHHGDVYLVGTVHGLLVSHDGLNWHRNALLP